MKKFIPHIILALVIGTAIYMVLTDEKNPVKKKLNNKLSFGSKDKIPYGTWVAYENLKHLFPNASISKNSKEPGYWDSLSLYDNKQFILIISPNFMPDNNELTKLIDFAKNGNDVFISSLYFSDNAQRAFKLSSAFFDYSLFYPNRYDDDTLQISLQSDSLQPNIEYEYPGRKFSGYFSDIDKSRAWELGYDNLDRVNFIKMKTGKGNIFIHHAPLAFSNYFLLHKKNISYYETAMSYIPKDAKQVVMDNYFIYKRQNQHEDKKGFMGVLFQYVGLKWAFIAALLLLLLYVLIEMRRKQRYIPEIKKPVNDSMEFVKTIGRLYFDRGDHKNLCRKMSTYFLEHIRNRYKLATGSMNEDFIKTLQFKSGYPEQDLKAIVGFINKLESIAVTDEHLKSFYLKLEEFYKKT